MPKRTPTTRRHLWLQPLMIGWMLAVLLISLLMVENTAPQRLYGRWGLLAWIRDWLWQFMGGSV